MAPPAAQNKINTVHTKELQPFHCTHYTTWNQDLLKLHGLTALQLVPALAHHVSSTF